MFTEDDLLPISALQHLLFCERQCALIHLEGLWAENRLTVEGRQLHAKTHGERRGPRGGGLVETRHGVRTVRGLSVCSLRLGLVGVIDVVEFSTGISTPAPLAAADDAGELPQKESATARVALGNKTPVSGDLRARIRQLGTPLPVEYKRGKPKELNWDRVQVCAQAFCLEEMLGVLVPEGAIFYGAIRHRERVVLDPALRGETLRAAERLREMISSGVTPPAVLEKKCRRCSLVNLCLPRATTGARSASRYLRRAFDAAWAAERASDKE